MLSYQETTFQTNVLVGGLDQQKAFNAEAIEFNVAIQIVNNDFELLKPAEYLRYIYPSAYTLNALSGRGNFEFEKIKLVQCNKTDIESTWNSDFGNAPDFDNGWLCIEDCSKIYLQGDFYNFQGTAFSIGLQRCFGNHCASTSEIDEFIEGAQLLYAI